MVTQRVWLVLPCTSVCQVCSQKCGPTLLPNKTRPSLMQTLVSGIKLELRRQQGTQQQPQGTGRETPWP